MHTGNLASGALLLTLRQDRLTDTNRYTHTHTVTTHYIKVLSVVILGIKHRGSKLHRKQAAKAKGFGAGN